MKNIKLFFYFYFFILISVFILGLFYDFQISQKFADLTFKQYYSTNIFAVVVEIFGEFPFYILIAFCFVVFCVYAKNITKKFIKFLAQFLLFFLSVLVIFFASYRTAKFAQNYAEITTDFLSIFALILISVLITFFMLLGINKLKKETQKKLFVFSLIIVVVSIISVVSVKMIKNYFCVRARFRTINFLNDNSLFNTFISGIGKVNKINYIGLPSDAFMSFPSGHTLTASIFLCFVFVPQIFCISNKTKYLFYCLPFVFVFIVASGRIVAGAHYVTDVVFSVLFVSILYFVCYYYLNKKNIN